MDGKISLRQRYLWVILGLLGLLLLFVGVDCGVTPDVDAPEEVTDQVRRRAAQVSAGQPVDNPPLLGDDNWHALNTGDAVKTDDTGEAELTLVDCTGSVWVFKNSDFGVYSCRKGPQASGNCQGGGDVGVDCRGRFTINTTSCTIVIQGTAFTVSYLPEEQLSLVTVLEGTVLVTPVLDIDTGEMATQAIAVAGGEFVYTVPGAAPAPIADLPARTALALDQLPPLVQELNIQPRFDDITAWGLEQKILPPIWPFIPDVGLWDQGGPLERAGVEDALLSAIDFKQVLPVTLPEDKQITFTVTRLEQGKLDAYSLSYDPEKAKQQLAEGGYPDGFAVQVVYPEGDRLLTAMAGRIAGQLANAGLDAKAVAVPIDQLEGNQLDRYLKENYSRDSVTFWLLRR